MPATEVSPSLSASPLTSGSDTEPESESRFPPQGPLRKLPVFSNGNGLRKEPETERRKSSNGWQREPETETSEKFRSLVDASQEGFIREAVEILIEKGVFESTRRDNRVLEWRHPEDLERIFDFDLRKTPESHQKLLALIKDTIKYSVKIGHPYFINQLYSSVDPYGLVGQWLTDTLNPSGYTYEVSPVFTLMEEKVLSEMRKMVGFHGGSGDGDGIFCPGGSMSNGYAISSARYHKFPQVKTKGLQSLPRLVLYTSADAHYSIKKMASLQGLGSDNVCLIPTDSRGKMDLNELEKSIEATLKDNAVPFLVSATAGTTVLGAYDPIEGIADICKKYDMWLHVDAAWGGGALMSKRYKHLLKGVERADSVTWNPHKLLAAPQQCSTFLTPHKNILSECHSAEAQYLFQKDKFYDMKYDTGDKHVQCGRRVDVLKFWFMWKAKGTDGLEQHVDTIFDNAEYFTRKIRDHPNFELVLSEPECTNICFWYIPPSLQNVKRDEEYYCKLNTVAPKIKERMMKDGTMMVTYQPLDDLPNFFRLVIQSSGLNHSDMDFFVEEIQRLGKDL